ncbi:MAG: YitT family protein [Gaiellales bacterium]
MLTQLPAEVFAARLPRTLLGNVIFGTGIAFLVAADLGLPPWDVLHQGLSRHLGLPIGITSIIVSFAVLAIVVSLREPIALGTLINIVVVGLTIDGVLALLQTPSSLTLRVPLMLSGPALVALGTGFYLGSRLGPGPRDGLMTALARRRVPIALGRWTIEATAFVIGVVLGGTIGIGTIWFLVAIGPLVALALRVLELPPIGGERTLDGHVEP